MTINEKISQYEWLEEKRRSDLLDAQDQLDEMRNEEEEEDD
jgi:hypothetical protein